MEVPSKKLRALGARREQGVGVALAPGAVGVGDAVSGAWGLAAVGRLALADGDGDRRLGRVVDHQCLTDTVGQSRPEVAVEIGRVGAREGVDVRTGGQAVAQDQVGL